MDEFSAKEVIYPPEELERAAQLYRERGKVYGDNYKLFGKVVHAMFPAGLQLLTVGDQNRWGILVQIVAKLTRYAHNFRKGGHDDSLRDIAVYAMMLLELDHEERRSKDIARQERAMKQQQDNYYGGSIGRVFEHVNIKNAEEINKQRAKFGLPPLDVEQRNCVAELPREYIDNA